MKYFYLAILLCSVTLKGHSQANLPTYCSAFDAALPTGWSNTGTVGTQPTHDECSGRAKRFTAVGQMLTINYNTAATNLKYSVSRNSIDNKTLLIEESTNGVTWTTVFTHTTANTPVPAAIHTRTLNPLSRFVRFNMTVRAGGRMEIDMVNIYNGTPNPSGDCKLLNLNCSNAKAICDDGSFTANNDDFGAQELNAVNQGCLSGENQSNWFYFQPMTSGTMEFLITAGTGVDYDFAIWTGTCSSLGTPVRCSWAATTVPTGLSSAASDLTEDAAGDAIVTPLNLVAGQTYILFIDNWTSNTTPFTIDFTLSGGASLDCTPIALPLEINRFEGEILDNSNVINWTTASEHNNAFFTLERSRNGMDFETLAIIEGAGNSTSEKNYERVDYDPYPSITYYRLKQNDFDGKFAYSQTIALSRSITTAEVSDLFPNPANNSVNFDLSAPEPGNVSVEIYDNAGRLIQSTVYTAHPGSNNFQLDISQLAHGVYSTVIRFEHLEKTEIRQLIKH
jgi:hypothetical protein